MAPVLSPHSSSHRVDGGCVATRASLKKLWAPPPELGEETGRQAPRPGHVREPQPPPASSPLVIGDIRCIPEGPGLGWAWVEQLESWTQESLRRCQGASRRASDGEKSRISEYLGPRVPVAHL